MRVYGGLLLLAGAMVQAVDAGNGFERNGSTNDQEFAAFLTYGLDPICSRSIRRDLRTINSVV